MNMLVIWLISIVFVFNNIKNIKIKYNYWYQVIINFLILFKVKRNDVFFCISFIIMYKVYVQFVNLYDRC